MEFKIGKEYSNKTIERNSKNISIEGQFIGGEHKITTELNTFVMLTSGAWKGGKSIYYKCIK